MQCYNEYIHECMRFIVYLYMSVFMSSRYKFDLILVSGQSVIFIQYIVMNVCVYIVQLKPHRVIFQEFLLVDLCQAKSMPGVCFSHIICSFVLLFTVTIQFLIGWCIYLIILRVFGSQSFRAIIIIFIIFIFLAPFCTSKSDYRGNTL